MAKKGFGIAGMLGEPRSGYPGGGSATKTNALIRTLYDAAGGFDGTGKSFSEFMADVLYEGDYLNKAEGGRIGLADGMTPSESWMRDYFYDGKGGYDNSGMTWDFFKKNIGPDLWYKHIGKAKGGRIGFQRAGSVPYLSRGWSQPGVYKAPRGYTGMQEILGGGILGIGASKLLKDKDKDKDKDKPVTKKTEGSKLPKKEPPKGEGILSEIITTKLLEDLVDVEKIDWDPKTGKETSTWKTYKRSDKNRPPTEEELEYDYEELWNDEQSPLDFGSTIAELDAALADRKAEWEYYRGQYMSGELDKYVKPEVLEEQREFRQKKISKVIEKAFEEIAGGSGFTGTDYKHDAQILADSIAEQLGKGALDELPQTYQTEIYNAAQSAVSEQAKIKQDIKKLSKPTKTLEGMKKTGIINISDSDVADEFSRFMKESDPEGFKDIEEKIQIESFDPKDRKKNALGGRIGYDEGGWTQKDFDKYLQDRKKRDKENLKKDFLDDFEQWKKWKETEGGTMDWAAQGGRIGLDTGGLAGMLGERTGFPQGKRVTKKPKKPKKTMTIEEAIADINKKLKAPGITEDESRRLRIILHDLILGPGMGGPRGDKIYQSKEDLPEGILEMLQKDPAFDFEEFSEIEWSPKGLRWTDKGHPGKGARGMAGPMGVWSGMAPFGETAYMDEGRGPRNRNIHMTDLDKAKIISHELRHNLMGDPDSPLHYTQPEWVKEYKGRNYLRSEDDKPIGTSGHELYNRFIDSRLFPGEEHPGPNAPYFDKILRDHWEPNFQKYKKAVKELKSKPEHLSAEGGRIGLGTGGPPITLQRPMFNEGGLTKTVPPERGPDPQGLPSALYNGIMRPRSY